MIAYLQGTLAEATPTRVVVDCAGVGYAVFIPVSSYDKLPAAGQPVKILIHHHVIAHEGTQQLYGFMTAAERDMFRLLIDVSGIGPKAALNILNSASLGALHQALRAGDIPMLSSLRGIGKKTAARLVLELKDKLGAAQPFVTQGQQPTPEEQKCADATLALVSLGFKLADAQTAVRAAAGQLGAAGSVEELVRIALRRA